MNDRALSRAVPPAPDLPHPSGPPDFGESDPSPGPGESAAPTSVFDTGLRFDELDPERPRLVETPFGAMGLFVVEGRVLCVQAFCPHLEGPLFQGSVSSGVVTCPWHAWRFDLRSGARVDLARPRSGLGSGSLRRCEVLTTERGTLALRPAAKDGA